MNKNELFKLLFEKFIKADINKLEQYVIFCLEPKEYSESIKTFRHHILPKANDFFPEYKSLSKFKWNCSILSADDHVLAHKLLFEATNNYKMAYAFINTCITAELNFAEFESIRLESWKTWALENQQLALSKSKETKESNGVYTEWGKTMSKFLNSKIIYEGIEITNAKLIQIKGNKTKHETYLENGLTIFENSIEIRKNTMKQEIVIDGISKTLQQITTEKILKTKFNTVDENGKNIFQQQAQNIKNYAYTEVVDENGILTTNAEINSRKGRQKILEISSNLVEFNGEILTHRERTGKRISETKNSKLVEFENTLMTFKERKEIKIQRRKEKEKLRKKYKIVGANAPKEIFFSRQIRNICSGLLKTSKDFPLGASSRSKVLLNRVSKLYMIGWYIIEFIEDI